MVGRSWDGFDLIQDTWCCLVGKAPRSVPAAGHSLLSRLRGAALVAAKMLTSKRSTAYPISEDAAAVVIERPPCVCQREQLFLEPGTLPGALPWLKW